MARNEEKQHGRLNRIILLKEKEEYEKNNPSRPKLNSLHTVEEIQKWLPSIKKDLVFYLDKSKVTCYSDQHIEECRMKVINLEKEFKAFVRKIKQLTPGTLDAIPWTSRAYKRKCTDSLETKANKQFVRIPCPLLEQEKPVITTSPSIPDLPLMNEPLSFNFEETKSTECELTNTNAESQALCEKTYVENSCLEPLKSRSNNLKCIDQNKNGITSLNIVNYDCSSDSDSS